MTVYLPIADLELEVMMPGFMVNGSTTVPTK